MADADWPTAAQWLASGDTKSAQPDLVVLGVPFNESITPGSCDLAPEAIRQALERYSTFDPDLKTDLRSLPAADAGDLSPEELPQSAELIRSRAGSARVTVLLGGDNGLTRAGVRSLGLPLEECGLLTFDAHHDLRNLSRGPHNGNPIRCLLEDGLPGRNIVQIGIQPFTNSPIHAQFAREQGITCSTIDEIHAQGIESIVAKSLAHLAQTRAIYVDLDVDVLDRAFAPACPGSRPGGLSPDVVRRGIRLCGQAPLVRVMDIVEVDPTKDSSEVTVFAAASFLLAFASGVAGRLTT